MATTGPILPRDAFIGRQTDLMSICRLISRPRVGLVTLTGPAGVGKTRLALELADRIHETGGTPAVTVVDLVEADHAGAVSGAIGRALGLLEASGSDIEARLVDALSLKPGLLVLDNFEHVLEAAPIIGRLGSRVRSLRILVTSRTRLNVRGEWVYEVQPLAVPVESAETPAELRQSAAIQLFVARASAAQSGFKLTPENARAVAAICTHLDGLPLAIEFAAARTATSTPAELIAALGTGLSALGEGPRDLPHRQHTLVSAIRWSYDLLDEPAQQVFRTLGVIVGSFTASAAAAVAGIDEEEAAAALGRLGSCSLLYRATPLAGEPRWRMLETVRSFALGHLRLAGEESGALHRHLRWLAGLAEAFEHGNSGPDAGEWLDRFEAEVPGLRVTIGGLPPAETRQHALDVVAHTWSYWFSRGRCGEAVELFREVAVLARKAPQVREARAICHLAFLAASAHDFDSEIGDTLDIAIRLATEGEDLATLAMALGQRAYTNVACGLGPADRSEMARAIEMAERTGSRGVLMLMLRYAGRFGKEFSSREEGICQLQRCLRLAHETGSLQFQGWAGADLARYELEDGHIEQAERMAGQAAQAFEALDHPIGLWFVHGILAEIETLRERYPDAARHRAFALDQFLRTAQRSPVIVRDLLRLCIAALDSGKPALAARLLGGFDAAHTTLTAEVTTDPLTGLERFPAGWGMDEMGRRLRPGEFQREAAELDQTHGLSVRYRAEWEAGRRASPRELTAIALRADGADPGSRLSVTAPGPASVLTARETELLRMLAEGLRNDEIAAELVISVKTVERHLSNLYAKLATRGRAGAVAYAFRNGAGPTPGSSPSASDPSR